MSEQSTVKEQQVEEQQTEGQQQKNEQQVPPEGANDESQNFEEQADQDDGGFSMLKNVLRRIPMAKPLMVVFNFFESCGITIKQLKKLAEGKANFAELDKTITPIVFKTVPALNNALEFLEHEHADGDTGSCYLLIRNVKVKNGNVQPYVFICTQNEEQQNVPLTYFPYFKSAKFILDAVEKHRDLEQKQLPESKPEND